MRTTISLNIFLFIFAMTAATNKTLCKRRFILPGVPRADLRFTESGIERMTKDIEPAWKVQQSCSKQGPQRRQCPQGRFSDEYPREICEKLSVAIQSIYDGKYGSSIRNARMALWLDSDNILALELIGSASFLNEDLLEARANWKRILEMEPDHEWEEFFRRKFENEALTAPGGN